MIDICLFFIIVLNIFIKVKFYLKDLMWINIFVCDIFICFFQGVELNVKDILVSLYYIVQVFLVEFKENFVKVFINYKI